MTKIEKLWEFMQQKINNNSYDKWEYNSEKDVIELTDSYDLFHFIKDLCIYYSNNKYWIMAEPLEAEKAWEHDESFSCNVLECPKESEINFYFDIDCNSSEDLFTKLSDYEIGEFYEYWAKKEYGEDWNYYNRTLSSTLENLGEGSIGFDYIILNGLSFNKSQANDLLKFLSKEEIDTVDSSFIYEKLEGDKLIENRGSDDAIHITVKSYKDKQTLFDIKQEKDEDDLHFYVRIENGRETFEYSRKIETQEDFCKALEQTINALENYSEFYEQRDELKEILEKFN